MTAVWDTAQHLAPSAVMDRVVLREAGVLCIGGERDEMLCREVAEILSQTHHPLVEGSRYRRQREQEGVQVSRSVTHARRDVAAALHASGRFADDPACEEGDSDIDSEGPDRATASCRPAPALELPVDVSRAMRESRAPPVMALDPNSRVAAVLRSSSSRTGVSQLPLFAENVRAQS